MHVPPVHPRAFLWTLCRSLGVTVLLALMPVAGVVHAATSAPRPALDAALGQPASATALAELARLGRDPVLSQIGQPDQVDERFGVPSFLIATPGATRPAAGATVEQAARQDLQRLAPYYRLAAEDVQDAPLRYVSDTGVGGIVAVFQQVVDDIPVFREEMKVLLDRQHNLVAVSGSIPSRALAASHEFRLGLTDAVAGALSDLSGETVSAATPRQLESQEGGYETFDAPGAVSAKLSSEPIRARRVYFRLGETLVPAYYVELTAQDEAPAYVIAADDGRVLFRNDHLAHDSFNYRVWADPSGLLLPWDGPQGTVATPYPTATPSLYTPPTVAPSLVGLQNGPITTNDPWLAPGNTTTNGQNVRAYLNAGTTYATTTSAGTFDRTFDVNQQPDASSTQQMAGVTQIFYTLNYLHDWFYDSGYTETAGNAQLSNYGRGGFQNDPIIAKTQISVNNNASMQTPSDGSSPVLSSYLWSLGAMQQVLLNSPGSLRGTPACGASTSNAATYSVTANIALPFPGTFSVQSTTSYAAGSGLEWVRIADLNGDGRPDLATANYLSNNVSVLLANGSGGFAAPVSYSMGAGPYTVDAGDLNGDGITDLVSANFGGSSFSVRPGTGGGAFGAKTDIPAGSGTSDAAIGRLDAGANLDVVTSNYYANTVSVFLGNGAGAFAPPASYATGTNPNWVEIGDVNGDGRADLVTANYGANSLSVLLGTVSGFGARTDFPVGNGPLTLALADLNGDGKLDAVSANSGASTVSVLLGNGLGGFGAPTAYAVPGNPVTVKIADANGDGIADVLVCSDAANSVSVLPNNGAGVLGAPTTIPVGTTPYGVALGDVTGDGQPDIVSANYGSNNLTLLRGTVTPSASVCPPYANTLTGRIALFSAFGGACGGTPDDKIAEAEAKGAVGALMEFSAPYGYGAGAAHGIPVFIIVDTTGTNVRTALRTGAVNASLIGGTPLQRDGALDAQIVAHEWGHSLSNRLIGNGNGLNANQAGGMGEGWSDFVSLLLTVRPEDASAPSNANWSGVFSESGHAISNSLMASNAWYFGLRRYPYTTDLTKNPLTFQHITNGVTLPVGPLSQPTGGGNAEVHNTGEVWCSMLWECYASLLRDSGRLTFTQARDRMRRYLVQSLQLTPVSPTFVEARDAMLMAAYTTDAADFQLFRAAFAKRGLGTGAVAPARTSGDNSGVVESFSIGGDQKFISLAIDDSVGSCDHDGILDAGEDGYITLKLWSPLMSSSLTGGTATFTSPNPNLQFPLGNTVAIPASQPFDTTRTKVRVHGAGAGIQIDSLYVQYNNAGWAAPGARSAAASATGNIDFVAGPNENFEGPSATSWKQSEYDGWGGGSLSAPWSLVQPDQASSNHVWQCPIYGDASTHNTDNRLTSPSLVVGPGNFSFTFNSAYQFATDPEGIALCKDGGVIEIGTNNGVNWADVGAANISPSYNNTVAGYFPLHGRQVFGETSPGYPAWVPTTVNLGTAYAGQTVKIRFWVEGDFHYSAPGWRIDDVSFTGITNAPFIAVNAEAGSCNLAGVDDAAPAVLAFAIDGENPGRGRPSFRFELPTSSRVSIAVYDVAGRHMATIADGAYAAGVYHAKWGNSEAPRAGLYFARMTADGKTINRRIIVVR